MVAAPDWNSLSSTPPPSWDDLQTPEEHFGSAGEQAKTALEQGISGLTGGASQIAETKLLGVNPEDIQARKEANPITAVASNLAGTAGLLTSTAGLGLGVEGAGLLADIASNAGQGALLSAANAVSNDLAFGDPHLAASKILSDAGLSALYGAATGGVGAALLGGASSGLKNILGKVKEVGAPDLTISPDALGPLDKIRLGLFHGIQSPEAHEQAINKVAEGLNSLNDLTSVENLSALSENSAAPQIEHFDLARKDFLKEFGTSKGQSIDPEEVLSFITNPVSKNSTQQTIAFNNYFRAIRGLSDVSFDDAHLQSGIKEAQNSLQDWMGEYSYANQTNPSVDIEYGGPKHIYGDGKSNADYNVPPKAYSTSFDLEPGKEITPGFSEGITIGSGASGSGPSTTRASSFGTERISPYDKPIGFSLEHINSKVSDYQKQVSDLLEKEQEGLPVSGEELSDSLKKAAGEGHQLQNVSLAAQALKNEPPKLGAVAATMAAHIPAGTPLLTLYSTIRRYSGDGGMYRLGNDIASPLKILDGIANTAQKVDDRIGDKARLIFTGASSQARSRDNNE